MIALHYARSLQTRVVHRRLWEAVVSRGRSFWLTQGREILAREFYRRHGLYPAGNQALNIQLDELFALSQGYENQGAVLRVRMEELFARAMNWLSRVALEVLTASGGDLLTGDTPALTVSRDRSALVRQL